MTFLCVIDARVGVGYCVGLERLLRSFCEVHPLVENNASSCKCGAQSVSISSRLKCTSLNGLK